MKFFKSCAIALAMYSKIPVPNFEWKENDMRYALAFFPLPGIIIGGMQVVLFYLFHKLGYEHFFWAALAVVLPIIITGGIHMDGYCDTIDALSSYQSKERRLEILKDSNAGAFAVIWAGVYFMICLGAWYEISDFMSVFMIALVYPCSRAFSGLAAIHFPSARKNGSLAAFSQPAHKKVVGTCLCLVWILCTGVMIYLDWKLAVLVVVAELFMFWYYYHMSKQKFGGITGDLAGWFVQCLELLVLVIVALGMKLLG